MRKTDLEWCNILEVLENLAFPSSLGVLSHPKLKRTNTLLKGQHETLMDGIVSKDIQKLWFHKNHVGIHKITAWSHLNSNFTLDSRHTRQTLNIWRIEWRMNVMTPADLLHDCPLCWYQSKAAITHPVTEGACIMAYAGPLWCFVS